ncbi:EscJ/YscJ/HrcJ family type III secretion inner membrane ring protein [Rouxiella sp. S1S-2]|uniref:type III secretion system inner membrane ring lipoprotein SctJ n=1 Tax=Rouxiella sp. S1S-2 TaxID=2653856 RepID=UPI0012641D9A|nr:type III secretion inner membrane ring lipoprotein SctJ [Rouxiella sp. S1S-2]KAB7896249.1 EscJ/YscJ/HrcJ family type III secretion inner membrane ring protein [Rouxiella sp. S1S-2]
MKAQYFILGISILLLTGCRQQELLKGLEQRQANEVIALLQRNKIDAEKKDIAKEGYRVSVDPKDFSTSVDLLRIYNLPSKPRMEIAQMFPSDSLISSPLAETARLYSAIEQRLEQSLVALEGITSAQIHVSYHFDSGANGRKNDPEHVAALISYDRNIDSTLMISDVKRLLKNSFNNLSYDNISVVLTRSPTLLPMMPIVKSASSPLTLYWWLAILPILLIAVVGYKFWQRFSIRDVSNG